ncbi:MAG: ABC transporter permease, partial [Terracidiphilus sp.]
MMFQDLRFALRQLRRAPGFAFTVALTLALSVGVATAVFCVIDTTILNPLPYAHPGRIVDVQSMSRSGYSQPASWPSFKDERAQATAFKALAAYAAYTKITMTTPATGPVLLPCVSSTDNFFDVFGVHPLLGRTYLPGEEENGRNDVAVLSYGAWQKYFDGDRNALGRTITLDGRAATVIGVMPAGFRFPLNLPDAIYTPRFSDPEQLIMPLRGDHWLLSVARLKDGVTIQQAQADLAHVFRNIGAAYPKTDGGRKVQLEPLAQSVTS